ncbi:MAG: LytR family transcriptional regulator [Armatimonadetes bacterium]|nr:LytR family transcriptional regulator [Armatimonadota bacterium]
MGKSGPTLSRRHEEDRRTAKVLDGLIYVLVVAVVGIGALGVHDILFQPSDVTGQEASTFQRVTGVFQPPFQGRHRVRILLMGADKRQSQHDEGRSDTLLVLSINPATRRAAVLGIPRDLKVDIPGHPRDKINHSYAFGGIELTRECIQELLREPINYHVLVYFHGFVKMVDQLGGVYIDVPDIEGDGRGMNYDEGVTVMRTHIDHNGFLHCHLAPGFQKLDGAGALGFVRYRKSTMNRGGDNDWARSGRQQQFLKAMAQQHLRIENVDKLLAAAGEMRNHITTDMSWDEIYDLLRAMKEVDPDELWTGTVPMTDSWEHAYYAILVEDQFEKQKADMERYLDGLPSELGAVEVLNASGETGRAHDAAQRLGLKGFPVRSVGNAPETDVEETTIHFAHGHRADAGVIASVLGCGKPEPMADQPTDQAAPPDLRVVIGMDYNPREAAAAAGELPSATN